MSGICRAALHLLYFVVAQHLAQPGVDRVFYIVGEEERPVCVTA